MNVKTIARPPTPIFVSSHHQREPLSESEISMCKLYCARGEAFFKLGRYKDSLQDATNAILINPDCKKAIVLLYNSHMKRKEYISLLQIFTRYPYLQEKFPKSYVQIDNINQSIIEIANRLSNIKTSPPYNLIYKPLTGITDPIIKITRERAIEILNDLRKFILPSSQFMVELLQSIINVHRQLPNIVRIKTPNPSVKFRVVGDTHGQFQDLSFIFDQYGLPSPNTPYIFNGDYVDRGSMGVEVLIALFVWKIAEPDSIYLNRGNQYVLAANLIWLRYFTNTQ